ncbi:hypothetical protein FIBSPDRAFT_928443 [Athelia psychrophila]|uniref:Transmembrane protein n=1 Tax=Athelia psychrophila TaxID=1759441 RepID=A0A166Q5B1_9AGAM|nr:hypothetical protein FIBSPDRAFT_928443 [Fibularhizoctonia sp. CBS 109695]
MSFKIVHLASLFLAFAFGVAGACIGLNALIKAGKQTKSETSSLPSGTTVVIDTAEVRVAGGIVAGLCLGIAINALISILFIVIPACARKNRSSSTLLVQSINFLILTLGLFAALVPLTLFFETHSAGVTAFIGSLEVPAAVVQEFERALGISAAYKTIPYLRLLVILPWFTFLFAAVATGVSFFGLRRASASAEASKSVDDDDEKITAHETTIAV